ncbi:MAG: hypothetical protein AVDCRST_MAG70-2188, partial [uncultured Thermomicrobiales bacterium]
GHRSLTQAGGDHPMSRGPVRSRSITRHHPRGSHDDDLDQARGAAPRRGRRRTRPLGRALRMAWRGMAPLRDPLPRARPVRAGLSRRQPGGHGVLQFGPHPHRSDPARHGGPDHGRAPRRRPRPDLVRSHHVRSPDRLRPEISGYVQGHAPEPDL